MNTLIEQHVDKYLKETYPEFVSRDWKSNKCTIGNKMLYTGEVGPFMKEYYDKRNKSLDDGKGFFCDKNTLVKSKCSKKTQNKAKVEKSEKTRIKKKLCYTEIEYLFPFEIFDNLEEPRKFTKGKNKGDFEYNRGFNIEFENKDTTYSIEAENFYNSECDKYKLNLILYAIHKNLDLINQHRYTLQMFSRMAYVAMCTYYDIDWKREDLYNNDFVYVPETMIFSTLICKAFTARCDFYNIVDEIGKDWNWPDEVLMFSQNPASCRNLPVTREWRNRKANEYLLDLIPKEAKIYLQHYEINATMDD